MKAIAKKLLCIVMCAVLCVLTCSCDYISSLFEESKKGLPEDTSLGYTEIGCDEFEVSDYYTPVLCRESYNKLENDQMRVLYDALLKNVYKVYPQKNSDNEYKTKQAIISDALLTQSQIRLTIKALTDDNPQVFWLSTTFGYLTNKDENYTAVQLYSEFSPSELEQHRANLKKSVDSFYSTLRKDMTQYELELVIHDYIIAICTYDTTVEVGDDGLPQNATNAFDVYGALVDKKAVCEGYSRAFQLLCNGVGIKCINVIGESHSELHMWNAVEIDSDYYYVDLTWDDGEDKALKYDYFNINEEQLLYDHEFSKIASEMTDEEICGNGKLNALTSNFFIPDCTKTTYNYYIKTSPKLYSYTGEEVISAMQTAAENKDEFFHVYIDPDSFDYDDAVDKLFFSYPQYFFDYVEKVNVNLMQYSIDVNDMSVYQKKQLSVVTVILKYL